MGRELDSQNETDERGRFTLKTPGNSAGAVVSLTAELGPEYATLKHRLENAHAAVEAALIEARRRVRMNEGRES